ncbi:uncharacterized protein LOC111318870 isoform X2 [Stylophora pistillata]|uniref:uncharacterized protein LOC111318870 isoform X2 n=1 Tax=Stylophora pistillata TaxID=50429 RepID=UPI000C04179D|nr:uncharacterized protein LOC111318870 isoform X2 [Stylophora pistillata]
MGGVNASFPNTTESGVALWFICRRRKLNLRIEVRYNAEVPPQQSFYLDMREGDFKLESYSNYFEMQDYFPLITSFLERHVDSRARVMTGLTCVSFYLRDGGSIVSHLMVSDHNEAWINKVDDHGRRSEFVCESNRESNFTTKAEFDLINNFVSGNRTAPWLVSVLCLFSGWAVVRFGMERVSLHEI